MDRFLKESDKVFCVIGIISFIVILCLSIKKGFDKSSALGLILSAFLAISSFLDIIMDEEAAGDNLETESQACE